MNWHNKMKFMRVGGTFEMGSSGRDKLHVETITPEEDNRAPVNKTKELGSLVIAVAGNLSMAALYFYAFKSPGLYADFIFKTGMLIYLVEFLSIHSSGMAMGFRRKTTGAGRVEQKVISHFSVKAGGGGSNILRENPRATLFGMYLILVGGISLGLKNWFIPLQFAVSLVSKFYGGKASSDPFKLGLMVILFIASTFAVVILAPLIGFLFPLPQEVLSHKLPGSSGLFIDTPQTLLAWGILYFASLATMEFALFWRRVIKSQEKPEEQKPADHL